MGQNWTKTEVLFEWTQAYKMNSKYPEELVAFIQKMKYMKDARYNR